MVEEVGIKKGIREAASGLFQQYSQMAAGNEMDDLNYISEAELTGLGDGLPGMGVREIKITRITTDFLA